MSGPSSGARIRILLVEDDTEYVLLLEKWLQKEGRGLFEAAPARRLDEAVERLRRERFDVVLLDLSLPDAEGLKTLRGLREVCGRVPIVIFTGTDDEELGLAALKEGAQDYLVKSAPSSTLIRSLRYAVERKQAQETERISQDRQRRLFDVVADAIMVFDPETLSLLDVNEAALKQYGYSREEMLRLSFLDLFARGEQSADALQAPAGDGRVLALRRLHKRRDGSSFPAEIHAASFDSGERRLCIAVARDITERVKTWESLAEADEKVRQAQKMDAVGRLAGGVAHDFNNLLTAILGLTDLCLDVAPRTGSLRRDIKEIQLAAHRGADLTQRLLAFSRRQIIAPKVFELDGAVLGLAAMLRRLIGEDMEFSVVPGARGAFVRADPGQLEQLVINLSVNARDAMPGGGRLTLETSIVVLDAAEAARIGGVEPGEYAALTVADTGTGMSDEVKSHLFEPFFTTKELGKGTGMGLAMCYGIAKQNGGAIECRSEPGRGTTFRVLLPRAAAAARPESPDPAAEPLPGGTETVLVVEDQADLRGLIRRVLGQHGYKTVAARDGRRGLARIEADRSRRIKLVVTDMVMPVLGGRELALALAGSRPEIKVLFTSGYADHLVCAEGGLPSGMNFLRKPFTTRELVVKVRQVLDAPATIS